MPTRIVIIGNSGSGKSHLAKLLSKICSVPIIHLDQLFWTPGGFNEKRPKDEVKIEVEQKRKGDSWIAEGVFGELAELFLSRAQMLVYLDMDWTACHASLMTRGSESSRQLDPVKAEENFKNLLLWAEQYWTRTNSCSRAGHLRLFDDFSGLKFKFNTRAEVDEFIKQQSPMLDTSPADS
jgi:adenylate kinase family enzyme